MLLKIAYASPLLAAFAALLVQASPAVLNEVTSADQDAYCTLTTLAPAFNVDSAALPECCVGDLTKEKVTVQPNLNTGRYFQYCAASAAANDRGAASMPGFLCSKEALSALTEGAIAHNVFLSAPEAPTDFQCDSVIGCTIQMATKGTDTQNLSEDCQKSTLPQYLKDPMPLIGDALVACSEDRTTYTSCSTQRSQSMLLAALNHVKEPTSTSPAATTTSESDTATPAAVFIR